MFSDADLRLLKKDVEDYRNEAYDDFNVGVDEVKHLIARLDAAEAYINSPQPNCNNCDDTPTVTNSQNRLYRAWQKSKGESA